jgi:hypothetical protein
VAGITLKPAIGCAASERWPGARVVSAVLLAGVGEMVVAQLLLYRRAARGPLRPASKTIGIVLFSSQTCHHK